MPTEIGTGTVLAGFRLERRIGDGAAGAVYLAVEVDGGRRVAVKVLAPGSARDERFRRRFLRESHIAASLDHPHVVPIVASGEAGETLFLAMAYIEGHDLRELLRREGRLDPSRTLRLLGQVADALDAAHRKGLVHRDVKPGNILVGGGESDERAYVCDFGLARHVSSPSSLTGERGFVGTIDYVPPEQIEGGTIDSRADVYSLGCVLFECLGGERPFERDSELSVVFAHLNEPPPRMSALRPELPEAFDTVFATALAKSPAERYATCGELVAAAGAALHGEVLPRRRPRRRLAIVLAAVLVAAGGASAGFLLTRSSHPPAATITPNGIGPARLGDSSSLLARLWNGGQLLNMTFPPSYSLLRQNVNNISAYFDGTKGDKAVELTTWNAADRTAEGVGPCSTLTELKRAYGTRLKAVSGNTHAGKVYGWTVGKHLFFAMGPLSTADVVETVGVFAGPLGPSGYDALNDGPCTGVVPQAFLSARARATKASAATGPALVRTVRSRGFAPRVTLRVPAHWTVRADTRRGLVLAAPAGVTMRFLLDPYAATAAARPRLDVSTTPAGLAAWLRRDKRLGVSAPATSLLGRPALTASAVDLHPGAKLRPNTPYLTFRGGARAALRASPGRATRLWLTSVRVDALVHTLLIDVDAPSRRALTSALPAAAAVAESIRVAAVPAIAVSKLSTECTPVFYGTCQGELAPGRHSTVSFRPRLTYAVPVGWTNFTDHEGVFGLTPPGGDWQAVDSGQSDYVDVFTSIATAKPGCADGPSTIHTPDAFLQTLRHEPGLDVSRTRVATVGGLSGYVVDLRMSAGWDSTCPWSQGTPVAQILTGLSPSPTGLAHGMLPRPMVMRLYLLRYRGGTLGIEIDEVKGDTKLAAYSAIVDTFRFGR